MKYTLFALLTSFLLAIGVSSCMKDSYGSDVTYYDDVAISAVTFGTLTQTLHTTGYKGSDSTYTTTYTGSNYPMYIDQLNHRIYNVDSLPAGTSTKMLLTITALNSGYIGIKCKGDTIFTSYSSSDTIDVSDTVMVRVLSSDYTNQRDYTMKVNIHNEYSGKFYWTKNTTDSKLSLGNMRLLAFKERMYVYGTDASGETVIYSSGIKDGINWTKNPKTLGEGGSLVTDSTRLYALDHGMISSTTDGINWTAGQSSGRATTLFAANRQEIYALGDSDVILKSSDQGVTWVEDQLYDDASLLPRHDISGQSITALTNRGGSKVQLFGNRDITIATTDISNDTIARVWTRDIIYDSKEELQPWYAMDNSRVARKMPRLEHLTVAPYGTAMLLTGGKAGSMNKILISYDYGLNWEAQTTIVFPADFTTNTSSFGFSSDEKGYLWLISSNGDVYKGYLTDLAWEYSK